MKGVLILDYSIPNPSLWKPLVVRELVFKPMRSRGPGGQHVNRTESAVQIVWPLEASLVFDEAQKSVLRQKLASMMNIEGEIYFRVESERSLLFNKEAGIKKVLMLIEKAFFRPKKRFKTKPSRSSVEKRINAKSIRGDVHRLP